MCRMTLIRNSSAHSFRNRAGYCLLCVLCILADIACSRAEVTPSEAKATPSNISIAVKPAQSETKQDDAKPVGKELRAADGPALKSITPPDGAVHGGILNDIAIDLPKPEYPETAKAERLSGTVTVEVVVNEKGVVVASSVVAGPQPLWSAAGAARKARFPPPR